MKSDKYRENLLVVLYLRTKQSPASSLIQFVWWEACVDRIFILDPAGPETHLFGLLLAPSGQVYFGQQRARLYTMRRGASRRVGLDRNASVPPPRRHGNRLTSILPVFLVFTALDRGFTVEVQPHAIDPS